MEPAPSPIHAASADPRPRAGESGRSTAGARRARLEVALCALLAVLGAWLPYALAGDVDLNMADEGFLWHGVERALAGDVPLRDFQAYDPGRYYWCAALSPLFGSGILGVRAAAAVFQALGLFLGALACRRVARSPLGLVVATAILWAWMFPRHKLFEPALALAAVYAAVRLAERPSARSHLAAGLVAGLFAWFGRNHALYAGAAFAALALLVAWKRRPARPWRELGALALGGVLGAAPLWGMMLVVPGFAGALLRSLELNLHHGANLALPYPWPWTITWGRLGGLELASNLALSAAFLLPFVVLPLGALAALRARREDLPRLALLLAATFVGVTYVHHVSVRSAVAHLAQCIQPLLLVGLALPACLPAGAARIARPGAWVALALLTALATARANPLFAPRPEPLVAREVRGETLQLPANLAGYLGALEAVVAERLAPEETLFVAPTTPTLYSVLGRRAPTWWLYFFWPADEAEQLRTIDELERGAVRWALVFTDSRLDGRADLAFESSNPLVWRYLRERFEAVPEPRLPPGNVLLRRRGP